MAEIVCGSTRAARPRHRRAGAARAAPHRPSERRAHLTRRGWMPTMMQAWSQQGGQVGQSHSVSPSGPRGWVAPQRQRMGAPSRTVRSCRSMAWRCPARGYQTNGQSAYQIIDSRRVIVASLCRGVHLGSGSAGVHGCPRSSRPPAGLSPGGYPRWRTPAVSVRGSYDGGPTPGAQQGTVAAVTAVTSGVPVSGWWMCHPKLAAPCR